MSRPEIGSWVSLCSAHQERVEGCPRCDAGCIYTEEMAEFDDENSVTCVCGFGYYRWVETCPACGSSEVAGSPPPDHA